MKNYYHILGVPQTATEEEIRQSYRKLAKEFHPDKNSGNDTRFVALNEAYSVLRDEHKRAAYDLDLTEDTAKRKAPKAGDPTETTAADFGGPDPAAEAGQWEDEEDRPVKPQSWNSQPYYVPRRAIWSRIRQNKYFNWVIIGLILWAVIILITHFTPLIPGNGEPSFTPLPSSGPQASGVPIVNPGDSTPTPSPSPSQTPSCPTGTPSITATNIAPMGGNGFNPFGQSSNDQKFTVSGTVTNSTSTAITIDTVGFYLGSYDSTRAPDNTVAWSNMTGGSTTVQQGQTVSWSTEMTLPSDTQNPPTAVLTFPDSDGAAPTPQWSYVGSSSSCSQSTSNQ